MRPHVRAWAGAILIWIVLAGLTHVFTRVAWGWETTTTSVHVLTATGAVVARGGLILVWVLGLAWILRATRKPLAAVILTAIVAGLATIASTTLRATSGGDIWHVHDRLTARDGQRFRALFSSDVIDSYQSLAVVAEEGRLSERLRIVLTGETYPGEAGAWFRPRRLAAEEGLHLEELGDRTIALLWNDEDGGHGAVFALSPDGERTWLPAFALFRANDVGDDDDLSRTAAEWPRRIDPTVTIVGFFTDGYLDACLTHESAWVRHAARTLVEAGGPDLYPQATAALRASAE